MDEHRPSFLQHPTGGAVSLIESNAGETAR